MKMNRPEYYFPAEIYKAACEELARKKAAQTGKKFDCKVISLADYRPEKREKC